MTNELVQKDGRINLKGLKWTKDFLATSGLALANLIDQPKYENDIIHVRLVYAAELIRDMQQAVNTWLEDYFPIEEALEDLNDMLEFMGQRGLKEEFDKFQSSKQKSQQQ